ncbi:MAG TPA: hypothetical protein PKK06_16300 [Phycisphaerae bacterium]|nr:hypothetical protein [Phycisphaerae bacterium]HNU46200.1 hypothetical protein [Phycisphaerae bacterium]
MALVGADTTCKRERALLVIRERGGIEYLATHADADATRDVLELLVLNEMPDRAPHEGTDGLPDSDTAFVRRVCGKLACDLRFLLDVEWTQTRKEDYFIQTINKRCRQTQREREGRYDALAPRAAGLLGAVEDRRSSPEPETEAKAEPRPVWWNTLQSAVLSRRERLAPLLALYEKQPEEGEALLNGRGRFDIHKVARQFGWTRRETRLLLTQLKREIGKVRPMVPRSFRDLCNRLAKLASTSFEGLADVEFRRELFDLSRSLATSFDPANVDARSVRRLRKSDFDAAVDLLIDEWQVSPLPQQRSILDRLRQSIFEVREALERGEVERAFGASPRLVLDAACVQHHLSSARLQVLLAYSYFLRVAGLYDAYLRANEAILRRCEVIVRQKGPAVLDHDPEFESGETLRRVRTYAATNILVCLFNYKYTTAPSERFQVKDYDAVVSLIGRFREVLADDPQAEFIHDELLVLLSHVVRAAYNLHRTAKGDAQKEHWRAERDRRRQELLELIEAKFVTPSDPRASARCLIDGTLSAAEGFAADRTLDTVEEVLHARPAIVGELRAERLAMVMPRLDQ